MPAVNPRKNCFALPGVSLLSVFFGWFLVFACVTAGTSRQKAVFSFFSATFRPTPSVTKLLQKTSIARRNRKSSADSNSLSWIHADALIPSGSLESPRGNRQKSSYSKAIRKPLRHFVTHLTGLFSQSRRASHGEKCLRTICVACAFASRKTPFFARLSPSFSHSLIVAWPR